MGLTFLTRAASSACRLRCITAERNDADIFMACKLYWQVLFLLIFTDILEILGCVAAMRQVYSSVDVPFPSRTNLWGWNHNSSRARRHAWRNSGCACLPYCNHLNKTWLHLHIDELGNSARIYLLSENIWFTLSVSLTTSRSRTVQCVHIGHVPKFRGPVCLQ